MGRSPVRVLSWIVAASFILATALVYVDQFNLFAKPPDIPESTNMVDRTIALADYFHAVWPLFLWTYLLFAIGFLAVVAFAANVASRAGIPGGVPTFKSLMAAGGVIGAIASIIPIGAAEGKVFVQYCDCGFKETEIVSQIWAQMLANGASEALVDAASLLAAVGVIAVGSGLRSRMPAGWEIVSWVTATALVLGTLLRFFSLGSEDLGTFLFVAISGVLVPIWSIWLAWSFRSEPRLEEPSAAA